MAYTQKTQKVEAKIQGTAFAKVTVKKLSPNIPVLEASLIKDAREMWKDISDQMTVYFVGKRDKNGKVTTHGTIHQYFRTRAGSTGRVKDYKAAIDRSVSAYKAEVSKYTVGRNKGIDYFEEWRSQSSRDLSMGMSGIKAIAAKTQYVPFQHRVIAIADKYHGRMLKQWKTDGITLEHRFRSRVSGVNSGKISGIFWSDRTRYLAVTESNLKYQDRMFFQMLREIQTAYNATYMKWRMGAVEDAMEAEQKRRYTNDVYLKNDGTLISQEMYYPEITTLRPFDVVSITAEDAPLFRGYPTHSPLWCRVRPELSSEGEIISSARAQPTEIDLGSDVRFVAGAEFWEPTSGIWRPFTDKFGYRMKANQLTAPEFNVLSYVSGREIITRESIRLVDGSFLDTDFGLDALESFTVSMVIFPNSQVSSYPLLDHQEDPGEGGKFAWWITDKVDFYYGGMGGSVDQMTSFAKTRPLIITSSVSGGLCTTTIAYSNRHNFTNTIRAKERATQRLKWRIGGSYIPLTEDQYADFSVFEFNLWARPLGSDEVTATHANLFSTYGVADDWR